MELSLDGRVAIVTGGGSGLGRGYARALSEAGAAVAVTGRRQDKLDETVADLTSRGGDALALACDQRSRADVERSVQAVVDWKGTVDILVNNAAIYPPGSFLDVDEEQWLDVMDTNVNGPFRFSQICGRVMVDKGYGRIVNILSPSAVLGFGLVAAYGTSKGALASMTRNAAAELGRSGVTVNSLVPGTSATETFVGYFTEFGVELMSNQLPVGRPCTDEDTAAALVYLASEASSYMTGATLTVDGGMTATFPMGG
jgi:gluconate 5-dehydrogenase